MDGFGGEIEELSTTVLGKWSFVSHSTVLSHVLFVRGMGTSRREQRQSVCEHTIASARGREGGLRRATCASMDPEFIWILPATFLLGLFLLKPRGLDFGFTV